jgi:hypothetical protein
LGMTNAEFHAWGAKGMRKSSSPARPRHPFHHLHLLFARPPSPDASHSVNGSLQRATHPTP